MREVKSRYGDLWDNISLALTGDAFNMCEIIEAQYYGRVNGFAIQDYIILPDNIPTTNNILSLSNEQVLQLPSEVFPAPWG